jgi:hypothetical protein
MQDQSAPTPKTEQGFLAGKLREKAGRRGNPAGKDELIASQQKARTKGNAVL